MASQSTQAHHAEADKIASVRCAIITISDTRTTETDKSGALIRELLEADQHIIAHYSILKDEPDQIRERVLQLATSGSVDVILTNGGTGIAQRDGTFEAISGILQRTMPGFGELFRMLSWEEVGAAAMLSRASAGLHANTFIFCMPGSTNAVGLAMRQLILPEIRHLVFEVRR